MCTVFHANPHYREYLHQLTRLHELIADGKGNSNEANAVREKLEQHVGHLNEREYRRAEGLCEDIYTLVEDEPPAGAPSMQRFAQDLAKDLNANWGRDWDRVLDLLREGAGFIPLDMASYARGRSWDEFGEPEIARLFFARAAVSSKRDLVS
ncbi:MAG TPA: hypothetical protein VND64_26580 [Pirellulales bacterium]|nr:hypothetical protein [Pirellulales bacterium]